MKPSGEHTEPNAGQSAEYTVQSEEQNRIPAHGTEARSSWIRGRLPVYLVMGSINCTRSPEQVLTEAIAGGTTLFQYREKENGALTGSDSLELARRLQRICRAHGVPFIVNDDLELALLLDADGVHIGQDDAPAVLIWQQLGPDKIVGVSAHSLAEAQQAIADGADYLGIGPVYPTRSKADAEPVKGTAIIEQIRAAGINIPLVGIGGIHVHNALPVLQAGADGIAVISAIAGAIDSRQAAAELAALFSASDMY
ncbi:thiamine phosphate synthase [Paenibacillus shenyangensis]|uniref:thiamine phosphate synthase n=1 Tax=Paenibacillus sp. A9 TaxID=1284352 RepID=UPI000377B31A